MAAAGVKPFEQLISPEDIVLVDTKIPSRNRGERFENQNLWLFLALMEICVMFSST